MDTKLKAKLDKASQTGKLELIRLELEEIPKEVWALTNLTILRLTRNSIKSLPPEIGRLTKLKYLYLNRNPLGSVPPEVYGLPELVTLDLGECELVEFPEGENQWANLKTLNLERNQLTRLPQCVFKSPKLKELGLGHNNLKELPDDIVDLKKMTSLDLTGNPLGRIPEVVLSLTKLKTLKIKDCQLDEVPDQWEPFKALKSLSLSQNSLNSVPDEIFQLPKLESLMLSDLPLTHLGPSTWSLPKLKYLNISNLQLSDLPPGLAEPHSLPLLQTLCLDGNPLSTIPRGFLEIESLEDFSVTNTSLPLAPQVLKMGWGHPRPIHAQGLLDFLRMLPSDHEVFSEPIPTESAELVYTTQAEDWANRVAANTNLVGFLWANKIPLKRVPTIMLESFLVEEFRMQLTEAGIQSFVERYGWHDIYESLRRGLLKIGAITFWILAYEYNEILQPMSTAELDKFIQRDHDRKLTKALERLDLKGLSSLERQDPILLHQDWFQGYSGVLALDEASFQSQAEALKVELS